MRIETPRLILREIRVEDADSLSVYRNHEEYGRYTTSAPEPDYDVAAAILRKLERAAALPKKYWPLVVTLKDTGQVIGDTRIFTHDKFLTICELAYGLNPDFWGQGYMSEAIAEIVKFCHDTLGMHRVVVRADARNEASWRVAEKAGLHYEGAARYEFMTWRGFMPELKCYASVRPDLIPDQSDDA